MLVLWEEGPHGVSNLIKDLILAGVEVGLILEWVEDESAEKTFIFFHVSRRNVVTRVVPLLLRLHVSLSLVQVAATAA